VYNGETNQKKQQQALAVSNERLWLITVKLHTCIIKRPINYILRR